MLYLGFNIKADCAGPNQVVVVSYDININV